MIEISNELKSHFLRLYQIAIVDDSFSLLELKMLYEFAKERDIPNEEINKILLTADVEFTIPVTVEKRIEYLFDFASMILADGVVTEDEKNVMKKYCRNFDFKDENIEELCQYLLDSVKNGKSKDEIINEIK